MNNFSNLSGQENLLGGILAPTLTSLLGTEELSIGITNNSAFSSLFNSLNEEDEDGFFSEDRRGIFGNRFNNFFARNSIPDFGSLGRVRSSFTNTNPAFDENIPTTTSPFHPTDFSVVAEGTISVNSRSDFDGVENNPLDDALLYGGEGFRISNRNAVLPVQLDNAGNFVRDENNRLVLVENAVAVSENYQVARASSLADNYSSLLPPHIVAPQTVDIPEYSSLQQEQLELFGAVDANEIIIPRNQLNSRRQWRANLPAPGTADNPTVIRVTGGGINIPRNTDLSNYVIRVEQGNINFNGGGQNLDNGRCINEGGITELKNSNYSN